MILHTYCQTGLKGQWPGIIHETQFSMVEPGLDYFAAEAWERQRLGVVIEGDRPLTGRVRLNHRCRLRVVRVPPIPFNH